MPTLYDPLDLGTLIGSARHTIGFTPGAPVEVVGLGDSRIAQTFFAATRVRAAVPLFHAAQVLPLHYTNSGMFGVVGENSTQILARAGVAVAYAAARTNPTVALLHIVNNDFTGPWADDATRDSVITLAKANTLALISRFMRIKVPCVIPTEVTRDSAGARSIYATREWNRWLTDEVVPMFAGRVVAPDIAGLLLDPVTYLSKPGTLTDTIHYSFYGAELTTDVMARAFAPFCAQFTDLSLSNADGANGLGPRATAFLAGGGTTGSGILGDIPFNWLTINSAGGFVSGTAVVSRPPLWKGIANWAQIDFNAFKTSSVATNIGIQSGGFARDTTLFPDNSWAQLAFMYEVDPGLEGVLCPHAAVNLSNGALSNITFFSEVPGYRTGKLIRRVARTPPIQIVTGVTTYQAEIGLIFDATRSAGITGTMRVGLPVLFPVVGRAQA